MVGKCHFMTCSYCTESFFDIPLFQKHVEANNCEPYDEESQEAGQEAMNLMARSLWKSVFMKKWKSMPRISHLGSGLIVFLSYLFFITSFDLM